MLLNALLGQQNPLAQWASGNNNFLTALGAGIASGPDLASGIGAGLRAAPQAKMADMEAAQQREEKARQTQQQNATKALLMEKAPDLAQLLDTGIPMGEVWGEYLRRQQPTGPVKPIEVNGQLIDPVTFEVLGDFRTPDTAKGGPAEVALQPTWLQDENGNWVIGQLAKDGSIVQTALPPGLRAADPSVVAGARASGTTLGKAGGQAIVDLPAAVQQGEYAVQQLKGLLPKVVDPTTGREVDNAAFNDQFGTVLGIPTQQLLPALPNTPKADFKARLDQVQGGAFLQAFESLKGGGAISEVEGLKAQQAIMRASTSQTPAEFEKAIREAITIYELGIQRAKDMAKLGPAGAANQVLNGSGGNVTSTGVTYTLEP